MRGVVGCRLGSAADVKKNLPGMGPLCINMARHAASGQNLAPGFGLYMSPLPLSDRRPFLSSM